MTSARQIAANRRNATKSTGPKSAQGEERSRHNALRHGLTAETVIGALEDAEDYRAFEEAIAAGFDAQSAVERELVLRLAGLLWRLRRTTRIEAGPFDIQATHLYDLNAHHAAHVKTCTGSSANPHCKSINGCLPTPGKTKYRRSRHQQTPLQIIRLPTSHGAISDWLTCRA
jgi:hypothetical protein